MRLAIGLVSLLTTASFAAVIKRQSNNSDYELKEGPLDTPWTETVGTDPWPEYPRPQLSRSDWKNLNGVWRYQDAADGWAELSAPPFGQELETAVLVPFCLESALSGVMTSNAIFSWYRTTFDVPSDWDSSNRVMLNFGAVDYNAAVFVNGEQLANHTGGYWHFSVDVTDQLSSNGTNELIVFVYDPTDMEGTQIPLGKQTLTPEHIFYTPCSGIWQTVWLESAPAEHITQLDVSADMDGNVNVMVHSSMNGSSSPVEITIYEPQSTDVKMTAEGIADSEITFTVDSVELWTPDSPTLYNMTVTLGDDTVQSYTGFRSVSVGEIDGVQRPLLNGEFVFQFGTLDQGYWPDGLHTPPSREAMVFDIEVLKNVGYNMLRKHIKVEPALFYQACDELGIMVIQDMPSLVPSVRDPNSDPSNQCPNFVDVKNDAVQQEWERQLQIMIEQHKSYPSIVAWVIYNEGWGQEVDDEYPEFRLTDMIRSMDPTRLIDAVSGWDDHGAGDYHDNHHYSSPQCGTPFYSTLSTPYDPSRIGIQGEFGGIGHNITAENAWKVERSINAVNQTYELSADLETWNYRAHDIFRQLREQIERYACSGAIWTQTTDVEGEVNGMVTYDRRLNRMDEQQWRDDIQSLYDAAAARGGNETMVVMPREAVALEGDLEM